MGPTVCADRASVCTVLNCIMSRKADTQICHRCAFQNTVHNDSLNLFSMAVCAVSARRLAHVACPLSGRRSAGRTLAPRIGGGLSVVMGSAKLSAQASSHARALTQQSLRAPQSQSGANRPQPLWRQTHLRGTAPATMTRPFGGACPPVALVCRSGHARLNAISRNHTAVQLSMCAMVVCSSGVSRRHSWYWQRRLF